MEKGKRIAALFDFDGVVMDTESQYTVFWNKQGSKYLGEENFGYSIKGQTLNQIYDRYFPEMPAEQKQITKELNRYESEMSFEYFPGVRELLIDLKENGVKTALVTSSDKTKMAIVYKAHPDLIGLFEHILTAENFTRSKPDPECFLLGMQLFDTTPGNTFIFEDSFHGLQAGTASGGVVIGLATTNSREALEGKAHYILDDFRGMTYEKLLLLV